MNNKESISRIKSVVTGIAQTPMLVNRTEALNLLYRYNALIESVSSTGSIEQEVERQAQQNQIKFFSASDNASFVNKASVKVGKFSEDFNDVPENSVAVVPVMGMMMRESYCTLSDGFISGTRDLESTVKMLDNNPNVSSIVFHINSGGGEARGNESLSRVIRNTKKPTLGYFEGMASAAVYSFQGVNELYAAERSSYWGSIGTYVTLVDDRELLKSMGIELLDIYAPQSTEKNKEFRDALEGDATGLKEMLKNMTDDFINDVKKSRPNMTDDGSVFKGKLYNAVQAKKIGAIDGIKSLDSVLDRAAVLGRKYKKDKKKNTNQNSKLLNQNSEIIMSDENTKKLGYFASLFGASASVEDAENDIKAVQEKSKELTQQVESLTSQNSAQAEQISQLTEGNEKLQNKINELEAAAEKSSTDLTEVLADTDFDNVSDLVADYKKVIAHNQELAPVVDAATPIDNQQSTSHDREAVSKDRKDRTYQDIMDEMNQSK